MVDSDCKNPVAYRCKSHSIWPDGGVDVSERVRRVGSDPHWTSATECPDFEQAIVNSGLTTTRRHPMVDTMNSSSDPRRIWHLGYVLLLIVPFIGLALTFTDPPRWLQIVGIVAILALVGTGSSMIRRRVGGWRPSETLTQPRDDER